MLWIRIIHQAKIVRKTLIFNVLCHLYDFLSLKNDVNVPSKSNSKKRPGSEYGSVSQWYGSADPDPYQNMTDPQQWRDLRREESRRKSPFRAELAKLSNKNGTFFSYLY